MKGNFMNKYIKTLALVAFSIGLGFGVSNIAMSDTPVANGIAVVNLDKVLSSSSQVIAVKKSQQKQAVDIQAWLKNAQADVDKQKTAEAKKAKKQQYEQELAKKNIDNRASVEKSLADIDKSVSTSIADYAKSHGYSVVLAKNTVLYGGADITEDLMKVIK